MSITIIVNTNEEHNKFWSVEMDQQTFAVTTKWGRIGTTGQSLTKSFIGPYHAKEFIRKKLSEKRAKGYDEQITQKQLDQMHIEAAMVGVNNKCEEFQWVHFDEETHFYRNIDDNELIDPTLHQCIKIRFWTPSNVSTNHVHTLIFTFADVFSVDKGRFLLPTDDIYKFSKQISEIICRKIA